MRDEDDKFDEPEEVELDDYRSYQCAFCGEENEVFLDAGAFAHSATQRFTEDCAICCRPNLITVRLERNGSVSLEVARDE